MAEFQGTPGNNKIAGTADADHIDGLAGNDTLSAGAGDDTVLGGVGNDVLDGGAGTDTLLGGVGNDVYIVTDELDTVVENVGEGIDRIQSSVSLILGANFENLTLTGGAIEGRGNELSNAITGTTAGTSYILGGEAGNDTLIGNSGNDQLNGGVGIDRMSGGKGSDQYFVDDAKDVVTESANQGTDEVFSSVSYALAANVERLFLDGAADLNGTGNTLGNVIVGNAGKNSLDGGAGDDSLNGLQGDDTLIGGAGNDFLNGFTGKDEMRGGIGNDRYQVDTLDDKVFEVAGQGTDEIETFISFNLSTHGANVENLRLLDDGGATLVGNALNNRIVGADGDDTLEGGAGNDTLDGGLGSDKLRGGSGNDVYVFDSVGGNESIEDESGIDRVESSVNFSLLAFAGVENLTLLGNATVGTGNALANVIAGNAGDNTLSGEAGNDTLSGGDGADILLGGAGIDRMTGGKGDDLYGVDDLKDVVAEAAGQGFDIVQSSISYTLGANIEGLDLDVNGNDINGTGNTLNNQISGNAGRNRLDGAAGNDILMGLNGDDSLIGGAGNDTLQGGDGLDSLAGDAGNDALVGGAGSDTLTGAAGNDTLVADNDGVADQLIGGLGNDLYRLNEGFDTIVEVANQGIDTVETTGSFSLAERAANVENLRLLGLLGSILTGNNLNNQITGGGGIDALDGGAGDDTLNGGVGKDLLSGGVGNDVYVVTDDVDIITENAGEGIDRVESAISFTLSAHVENLTLTGAGDIDGIGNDLANLVAGNAGHNVLLGNAGNDTLIGGAGNDILAGDDGIDKLFGGTGDDEYIVDTVGDTVTEGANQGIDVVQSTVSFTLGANIEELVLNGNANIDGTGNTLANVILGNAGNNRLAGAAGNDFLNGDFGNDTIDGGTGNDVIEGGRGADVMTGGAGVDRFLYRLDALVEIALIGGDTINGFQHGVDKIDLSDILSDFGIGAGDAFTGGFLKIEVVGNNTQILFDQNGGGNDFITLATLNNVRNITAGDLLFEPV